jgi:6-phosphogluconolactonase/glucosamine-6-phosphate isomerase/deaminase
MTELRPPIVHSVFSREKFVSETVNSIAKNVQEAIEKRGSALVGFSGDSSLFEVYANLGKVDWVDWSKVTRPKFEAKGVILFFFLFLFL